MIGWIEIELGEIYYQQGPNESDYFIAKKWSSRNRDGVPLLIIDWIKVNRQKQIYFNLDYKCDWWNDSSIKLFKRGRHGFIQKIFEY